MPALPANFNAPSLPARLRLWAFSIPDRETSFEFRGFEGGSPAARSRVERIGETFVRGYRFALLETRPDRLAGLLESVEVERRGFAYEGAAMALALQDLLTPWQGRRFQRFLDGPGNRHAYMVHVGVGWALARLPRRVEANLHRFDPLLRWLILDGYGFHQGYFHWRRFVALRAVPKRLSAYGLRAFDQGLGRSLWFVNGAEVERIAQCIEDVTPGRRPDLWAGVGLASAYAGGVGAADLSRLHGLAGAYCPHLAQGASFAAKARQRAGNPAPHTDLACRQFCAMPAEAAAELTDETLQGLPPDGGQPAFEVWRTRIRQRFGA